jgi:hypothetical protein
MYNINTSSSSKIFQNMKILLKYGNINQNRKKYLAFFRILSNISLSARILPMELETPSIKTPLLGS